MTYDRMSAAPDGMAADGEDLERAAARTSGAAADLAADAPVLPQPATRTWQGGTDDWYDSANWQTASGAAGYPMPGDTAVVASGTAVLVGSEAQDNGLFGATNLQLGSSAGPAATLDLQQATLGGSFTIEANGNADVLTQGTSTLQGSLTLDDGANVGLGSMGTGDLILGRGFALDAASGTAATLTLTGNVTLDGVARFGAPPGVSLTNNADVTVVGLANDGVLGIQGGIGGTGTFDLGLSSDFKTAGAVGAGQTFNFAGAGARLDIGDLTDFHGTIENFAAGDVLGLTGIAYNANLAATYDPTDATVTVTNKVTGATLASIDNVSGQTGPLYVGRGSPDMGISIGYAPSPTSVLPKAGITGADAAMRADVARTMLVPGTGTPITGAGVKIGVISTSFDSTGTAAGNMAAGYLPKVEIAEDNPNLGEDDEGQAMAEEIHQVAPGSQIEFCAADDGTKTTSQETFAQAVQRLKDDHCDIIVDDVAFPGASRYQVAGPAATAVQGAVDAGIDYFSSTGNEGQAFLNQTFTASSQNVDGLEAHQFDNGTPYERFTVRPGSDTTAYLQWAAPYENPTGGNAPQDLSLRVYNAQGTLVGSSAPIRVGGVSVSAQFLTLDTSDEAYYFAVVHNDGTPVPSAFNVTLVSSENGTGAGGVIDDPQAGMGSDVVGAKVVPGVNSVGAIFYGESAAYGQQPTTNEGFSSYGGETQILYAPDGTPLASPQMVGKPTFSAPDGVVTTVPGSFSTGFFGTSAAAPNAAAVAALMLQANPDLTTSQITSLLAASAIAFGNPNQSGAGLIQADKAVQAAIDAAPVCFAAGTRIRTVRGDVAVERLRLGDRVLTAHGQSRAIRWLGSRTMRPAEHAIPSAIWPVRILAGAFGGGLPDRALYLSPGHPVLVGADEDGEGGCLVPVMCLINGTTIERQTVESITYWHVELDAHDILLAEGLPAESYLDWGDRSFFTEGAHHALANPDFVAPGLGSRCRPVAIDGPVVETERRRLDSVFAVRLAAACDWSGEDASLMF